MPNKEMLNTLNYVVYGKENVNLNPTANAISLNSPEVLGFFIKNGGKISQEKKDRWLSIIIEQTKIKTLELILNNIDDITAKEFKFRIYH